MQNWEFCKRCPIETVYLKDQPQYTDLCETKVEKKVEESKTKLEYKPLELKKQPLEDTTNALKDKVKTVEEFQAL